ncbi:MAG: disulfide bond formation protein B [Alphaproteobacteria bacterium]|nr:disulfide bond formation protein B [Alphaproteobacteria bacterium]
MNLRALLQPPLIFLLVLAASAMALIGAYSAEYGFGLAPCILCLYQRIPFFAALLLSSLGIVLRQRPNSAGIILALLTLAFTANAALAFYHSGVELHWWPSIFEACAATGLSGLQGQDLAQAIMAAPAVRCDVIPWVDPLLGLSMANYNVLYCLGLAGLCTMALWNLRQSRRD